MVTLKQLLKHKKFSEINYIKSNVNTNIQISNKTTIVFMDEYDHQSCGLSLPPTNVATPYKLYNKEGGTFQHSYVTSLGLKVSNGGRVGSKFMSCSMQEVAVP